MLFGATPASKEVKAAFLSGAGDALDSIAESGDTSGLAKSASAVITTLDQDNDDPNAAIEMRGKLLSSLGGIEGQTSSATPEQVSLEILSKYFQKFYPNFV